MTISTCVKTKKNSNHRSKRIKKNSSLLIMSLPAVIAIFLFNYLPMIGIVIAFKKFRADKGIWGSKWVGLDNFKFFFTSQDAWRITRNTVGLNFIFIVLCLIFSVVFAIMLNEITKRAFVKFYQTVFFFPYFLSWVVVGFMLFSFLNSNLGILNNFLGRFGVEAINWYNKPSYWPGILTFSYIWKNVGYFSVIYYAGIMGINNEYYEAAAIDGANRLQMIRKITLPLLSPIITIMVLLQIGKIFYADFGMFFFLPRNIGTLYATTDVIDTYVYRALRVTGDIGMASAVGFYQSIVGFLLVILSNWLVRKFNEDNALF